MTVKWYGKRVQKELDAAGIEILEEAVTRVIEIARDNVRDNNQIDTAHMFNSFYTVTINGSTYDLTSPPGQYFGVKSGRTVRRERAPEVSKPSNPKVAFAANSAPYALYPELQNSFFFRAALLADKEIPSIVREVKRRRNLD